MGTTVFAMLVALATVASADRSWAATVQEQGPKMLRGSVASVTGGQSCGSAAPTESFQLDTGAATFTVEITPTTAFEEHRTHASFSAVCVGDKVKVRGPIAANDVVTASEVAITPPIPHHVAGAVTSVNGSNTAGECGMAGQSGTFTLATLPSATTVSVTPSTGFAQRGDHMPSFASVCVGDKAHVQGPIASNGVLSASHVTVVPPPPQHVLGSVVSVAGSTAPSACGTSGASGSFGLMTRTMNVTVIVSTTTTFAERGKPDATFGNVCVGDKVRAVGTDAGGDTMYGVGVAVIPPPPRHIRGIVSSVNGSGESGVCGSGSAGRFTVPKGASVVIVDVGSFTLFGDPAVSAPSFSQVCVGNKVQVTGTGAGDGTLEAARVAVVPPEPKKVSGTVVSVDGASTQGTCGSGGNAGAFTVATRTTSQTVDVAPSTLFQEEGVSAASFQVVCVGDRVSASGTQPSPGQPITATEVVVTTQPR
jgi:hypothetical protein